MSTTTKVIVLLALLVIGGGAIAAEFISVREEVPAVRSYTANSGELTGTSLVGQTFTSPRDKLSGVSVMFATYSGRDNTHPVLFGLRTSPDSKEDLRTSSVHPQQLGDNQFYRFEFEPLEQTTGQQFFFYVISPDSVEGNAVTVDLNTQDPYHLGTAFVVRNTVSVQQDASAIARGGKQTIDVTFATHHSVSMRQAIVNQARSMYHELIGTWPDRKGTYYTWVILALPVILWLAVALVTTTIGRTGRKPRLRIIWLVLGALLIAGIALRLFYAASLPLTNDEGNYLYDAQSLLRGILAGGDGYVKAPLVVAWTALWQFMVGNTVLAGRLAAIVASALIAIPLYLMASQLRSRMAGVAAAATWLLVGAPVVFGIYTHTQSLALLFGVSGLALVTIGTRRRELSTTQQLIWLLCGGVLLGLGVASRKSILALGLVPVVLVLLESTSWRQWGPRLVSIGVGFVFILALFLGAAHASYGTVGIVEALGINSAEDGLIQLEPREVEQVRAYSIRGITPLFREAFPLIFLAVLGWGLLLERLYRKFVRQAVADAPKAFVLWLLEYALPLIAWVPSLAAYWWAWSFYIEYEGEIYHRLGWLEQAWWAGFVLLVIIALWPAGPKERFTFKKRERPSTAINELPHGHGLEAHPAGRLLNVPGAKRVAQRATQVFVHTDAVREHITLALIPLVWIGGLAFFYYNWIKFHANYLVEFLPPLALLAGVGVVWLWRLTEETKQRSRHVIWRWIQGGTVMLLGVFLAWTLYLGNYITYTVPHTGTFQLDSIQEAADWAKENIPADETIFTGAAIVPYLSGHHTALDIAHPRWYAYEFTRKDPDRLNVFLPPIRDMLTAYRQADWFLREKQTGFSFLMEYSEIEAGLEVDWEIVHEVENGSNTLVFYKRIAPPSTQHLSESMLQEL